MLDFVAQIKSDVGAYLTLATVGLRHCYAKISFQVTQSKGTELLKLLSTVTSGAASAETLKKGLFIDDLAPSP